MKQRRGSKKIKAQNWNLCEICGGEILSRCRCSKGIHDVDALKNGHGRLCENGHRLGDGCHIMDLETIENMKKDGRWDPWKTKVFRLFGEKYPQYMLMTDIFNEGWYKVVSSDVSNVSASDVFRTKDLNDIIKKYEINMETIL